MHKPIDHPIVYLDFDGVLHPDAAHRIRGKIVLLSEGARLFQWAHVLAESLEPFPQVRIVLSTSWVRVLSYTEARAWLPEPLAARVIGATWHSAMNQYWWYGLSRYEQIRLHRMRHKVSRWLAIDDDVEGWPEDSRQQLISTDPMQGIGAPETHALLLRRLEELVR